MRLIGIPKSPVSQRQRTIQQTKVQYAFQLSFALPGTAVNQFKEEATTQFRDGNNRHTARRKRHLILIRAGITIGFRTRRSVYSTNRSAEQQRVEVPLYDHAPR